jgi:hypothetical protein
MNGMKISDPPKAISEIELTLHPAENLVQLVNRHFDDNDFELRYFPKFEWFKDELPKAETLLDIGCGQGRETSR